MSIRYRINEPDVTHESFDAEILVINLKNGNYYSMLGTAIPAWQLLAHGVAPAEVARMLAGSGQADATTVSVAIGNFVETLVAEALLVPRADADVAAALPAITLPTAFTPPQLDRYTDMQQLLLMDPIHEVDATGWPMAKPPVTDPKA